MTHTDAWTPAQEAALLEVCQHIHRIGDIKRALEHVRPHITRNAVIGKIQRMRKRGHDIATGPPGGGYPGQNEKRRKVRNPQSFARVEVARVSTQPKPKLPPPEPPRPDPPIRSPRLLTLMELGPHHCRWPIGDNPPFLFCGAPAEPGLPYCPGHVRIARGGERRHG